MSHRIRWTIIGIGIVLALAVAAVGIRHLRRGIPFHEAAGRTIVATRAPVLEAGERDWPQFRGPARDGKTPESDWVFPESGPPRELWRKELGTGAASLAISRGRLFTVGSVAGGASEAEGAGGAGDAGGAGGARGSGGAGGAGDADTLYCLSAATGEEIWRFVYACSRAKRQFEGGPAATPTVDGDRVYTLSHEGQLFALDAATGALGWALHLVKDFGGKRPTWGFAGSPLVVGEKLIVDAGGEGASTVALEKETGATIWKAGDDGAGYASPILFEAPLPSGERKAAVLVFKAKALVAQALDDGRVLWRHPWETSHDVHASTPAVAGDRVFISSGYGTGSALLDVASGEPGTVWENEAFRTHFGSCLIDEGTIYGPDDSKQLRAADLATGKVLWRVPDFGKGTVILAGKRLIGLSEGGEAIVLEARAEGPIELARAKVIAGRCWVSPALANGLLYVRNNDGMLVCLDLRSR